MSTMNTVKRRELKLNLTNQAVAMNRPFGWKERRLTRAPCFSNSPTGDSCFSDQRRTVPGLGKELIKNTENKENHKTQRSLEPGGRKGIRNITIYKCPP